MIQITKDNLELNLKEATSTLIEMVEKFCWNKISENTTYLISETANNKDAFIDKKFEFNTVNFGNKNKSLEQVTIELKEIYEDLYDVNLYIYKSERKITIIEITYFRKSSLEYKYYETVKERTPMLHCKIERPKYLKHDHEKFDINWKLGGIRNEWNSFIYKIRFKFFMLKNFKK